MNTSNIAPADAIGRMLDASPTASPLSSGNGHLTQFVLLLVILFSTALDLWFFTGFYASDDISYFGYAVNFLRDEHYHVGFGNSRLILIGWNLLWISVFGWNVQIIAATYILFHQALNLFVFLLARRLFNRNVGLIAVYVTATLPMIVTFSTLISPDIPLACFCILSLYAFLRGLDERRKECVRPACLWLLLAGVSVGFTYMAKESGLVLLPFYFVFWMVAERREGRSAALVRGAAFAAGFFIVLIAETAVLSHLDQKLCFRLGLSTQQIGTVSHELRKTHGTDPLERLKTVNQQINPVCVPPGFKVLVCAGLQLCPFVCRRCWPVHLLAVWLFAYFTWGTMKFTEYAPPSIQPRYYIPVAALLIIVCAAAFTDVFDRIVRRVKHPRWRTLARVVAVALVVAYPLTALIGPDQVAGKMYKAAIVGSATRAIQHAAQQDDRPIILSDYLTTRMYRLTQAASVNRVTTNNEILGRSRREAMLATGGWYFVAVSPRRIPRKPGPGSLNTAMHWFVDHYASNITDEGVTHLPRCGNRVVWSMLPPFTPMVECGSYQLSARQIQRFGLPTNRSLDWAAQHLRLLNDCVIAPDPSAHSVLLLDIVSKKLPSLPHAKEQDSLCEFALNVQEWTAGDAFAERLSKSEAGGFSLIRLGADDGHTWLTPRSDSPLSQLIVGPEAYCEFDVDVEMSGSLSADLIIDAAEAGASSPQAGSPYSQVEPAARRRIELNQGENSLRFRIAGGLLRCKPAFEVRGEGRFSVNRFAVRRIHAQYFRDTTDLLHSWAVSTDHEECNVSRGDAGELNLTFMLPKREVALFEPCSPAVMQLPENGRYDFSLSTKLKKFARESHVELDVRVFDSPTADTPIFHRRILLDAGDSYFSLRTGDVPVYVRLAIRAFGRARLSINELSVRSHGLPIRSHRAEARNYSRYDPSQ